MVFVRHFRVKRDILSVTTYTVVLIVAPRLTVFLFTVLKHLTKHHIFNLTLIIQYLHGFTLSLLTDLNLYLQMTSPRI